MKKLMMSAAFAVMLPAAAPAQTTEVIVHGTRLATYRGDALFSHVDIGKDDIARVAAVDQALKGAAQASLFRRNSSLTANPTVQGLSLRAIGPSGAGRALVTLDGIPQNDPFGGWVVWAGLPTGAIGRAHVLRGAGGGAYGAGALTGVVDLSLDDRPGFYAGGAVGSHDSRRLGLGWTGPVSLFYDNVTLHGDVPVRNGQAGAADVATYGHDQSVLGSAGWALGDGELSLLAGSYDSRRDTGLAGAVARSIGDQIGLSFTRQPAEKPGFRLQIWRQDSNLTNRSVSVAAGRSGTTLANDQVKTPADGEGFNAALRGQAEHSEWEFGIDGRLSTGESREFYRYMAGVATRYRVSGGKTSLAGAYGEGTRSFGALSLTGALRIDRWRAFDGHRSEIDTATGLPALALHPADQADTIASGRVGLGYASGETAWRAAAYTGFRPPSLNELYRPFRVGNDVTEANENLKPERLQGAEAGVRVSHARWTFDGDVFINRLDDPITNVTLGLGPGTFGNAGFIPAGGSYRQRRNIGRIDAHGIEAQVDYDISQRLTLSASGTWTHARTNGRRPAEAPGCSATVAVDWRPGKANVNLGWSFEGDSFDDDLNTLPLKAYDRLSLDIAYPLARHLDLTLAVDNALNHKVEITHGGDGIIGYDGRRSVWIGLAFHQ
ncbi:MAG TPA: TonB-dependent receptor [Asticcacaulis sp.]|nr:TonB-dependent receptor [Asticcacaulis sp.]